ncbi:MAG: biotin transporter BioY [Candidatus Omnitrophica bacterium]|nr:biotin transporter BioY [Candidatus Omnitrophota bacterium]MDD5654707.1 biotin transporter BioY [Candidatus Omnitrophota bacterium]
MELILKREVVSDKITCRVIGVAVFVVLMALGAFVRIPLPFSPVPLTLQTFFVLLSGAVLGGRLGLSSQAIYMMLGIAGMPIFANASSGFGYLLGPTGGYIMGFFAATMFLGMTMRHGAGSLLRIFALMCVADAILLFCGIIWLKVLFGYDLSKLFLIGFVPFIPGDALKAAAASVIAFKMQPRMRQVL